MYSEKDWAEINALIKKRCLVTLFPSGIILAAAITIFVYGQLNRSEHLWMLTSALTILGGGYLLFFYGVFVRPALIYRYFQGVFRGCIRPRRHGGLCHARERWREKRPGGRPPVLL